MGYIADRNWQERAQLAGHRTEKELFDIRYIDKKQSTTIIAKTCKCSSRTVLIRLSEKGYKVRPQGGANRKPPPKPTGPRRTCLLCETRPVAPNGRAHCTVCRKQILYRTDLFQELDENRVYIRV